MHLADQLDGWTVVFIVASVICILVFINLFGDRFEVVAPIGLGLGYGTLWILKRLSGFSIEPRSSSEVCDVSNHPVSQAHWGFRRTHNIPTSHEDISIVHVLQRPNAFLLSFSLENERATLTVSAL